GAGVVAAGVGAPVGVLAVARDGAGDVAAVAVAVERGGVRRRGRVVGRVGGVGVVVIAGEVHAGHDLRAGELVGGDRLGQLGLRVLGLLDGADAAEVGVRVVDAGVDHGHGAVGTTVAVGLPGRRSVLQRHGVGVGDRLG